MPISGVWVNKRGSVMVLREESSGHVTGEYRSAAGRDLQVRELAGRASTIDGNKQMVGFSVCFHTDQPSPQFGHTSVCTWSGWVRNNTLTTRWLLTRSMSREEDEWSSTIVGQDSFEKLSDVYDEGHLTASKQELEQWLNETRTRKP
jgi:avidin family protein